MKPINILLLSLILLPVLAVVSCDILSEDIVSGVTADAHYTTPEGFQDAVNATYFFMREYYGQEQGGNLTAMGTDIITNGGPKNSTMFYALYLYRKAFTEFQMGYASVLAWVLFIIIAFFTYLVFRTSEDRVFYQA
jgi:hypothetical protein